jgi:hypothetical protein
MLEIGKSGSAGVQRGELPVLRDGVVVARLEASNWKEQATAAVGDREWLFTRMKGELTARWAADPADTARLRARSASWWKGTWQVDLDGTGLEMRSASAWKGTHRFVVGDRQVAESGSTGGWSPRPTLTADESLPLDHQVFLLWLELVMNRRNMNTAVAAGAGAAIAGSN